MYGGDGGGGHGFLLGGHGGGGGGGGGGLGGSTLVTQVFSMKPWPANWKLRPVDCSVSITSEVPYANVRKVTWKQSLFRRRWAMVWGVDA